MQHVTRKTYHPPVFSQPVDHRRSRLWCGKKFRVAVASGKLENRLLSPTEIRSGWVTSKLAKWVKSTLALTICANVGQRYHWQQIKPLQRRIVSYRFCKFGCDIIPLLLVVYDFANMETWKHGLKVRTDQSTLSVLWAED